MQNIKFNRTVLKLSYAPMQDNINTVSENPDFKLDQDQSELNPPNQLRPGEVRTCCSLQFSGFFCPTLSDLLHPR